ncbi:uncharacterized protein BP5553_08237 [Venustampulla echinocandica]|uniref:Zn(2)-C6 fungal-type domain-containing protein n=1 Tax=Venustampulla echinocandica TaxID=2656787 RepID=A0A370TG49_9HELO|nr:uncharacterized protein BP5553_08237 [Venustampulla echinocandica]RDL33869.1 hypothetical protein BP5553_08237 [Venustampulla echinocandica]
MGPSSHVLSNLDLGDLSSIRRVMAALSYNLTHIVLNPGRPEVKCLRGHEAETVATILFTIQFYPDHTLLLHATLLFIDVIEGSDEDVRRAVEQYVGVTSERAVTMPWMDEDNYFIAEWQFFKARGCERMSREQLVKAAPAAFYRNQVISTLRAQQLEVIAAQTNRRVIDIPAKEAIAPLPQGPFPDGIQTFNSGACDNCVRKNRFCNRIEPFCWECRSTWTTCGYSSASAGPRVLPPRVEPNSGNEVKNILSSSDGDDHDNKVKIDDADEDETEVETADDDSSYEASGEYSPGDDDVGIYEDDSEEPPTIAGRLKRSRVEKRLSLRSATVTSNFQMPTTEHSSGSELSDAPSDEENPFSDLESEAEQDDQEMIGTEGSSTGVQQLRSQQRMRPEMEGNSRDGEMRDSAASGVKDGNLPAITALYTSFTDRAIDDGTLDRTPPLINEPSPAKRIITFQTETSHRDTSVTTTIATYHYLGFTDWNNLSSVKKLRAWRSEIITRFFGRRRRDYERWTEIERDALFTVLRIHVNEHGENGPRIDWADIAKQLNVICEGKRQKAKEITAEVVYQFTDNRGVVRQARILSVPLGKPRMAPARDGEGVRLAMMQFTHPLAAEIVRELNMGDEED